MEFKLYKVSGYEETINSLRMSKGKFYSWEKAQEIQLLVYRVTNAQGFLLTENAYREKNYVLEQLEGPLDYEKDVAEFKRLLQLTFNNAMGEFKHHTLMKYIDISFFTEGLHRGAQDDLDAHAIAFNNRITRYSTRLAEIDQNLLSEWYQDKIIPFSETPFYSDMPNEIYGENGKFIKTPFGWVIEKYAQVPAKNGLAKDVQRGGMLIGMASNAIWKTDLFNLRYVYKMRSKLTKANPELKIGMEQLADQIEEAIPVFGPYFRKELTDSGTWEHMNKIRTISSDEWNQFKEWKKGQAST
ncbi:thymidylate synthase [Bacillus phage vB_BboS-125]|uniref:Uncharacterized protein n=1 Tax=Bacillus phage vB_BboS-125 TaxID=2419618 RepID=A0A3G3BVV3_9CAUD|nr:thymidylate synthase [Bacillus phage vB_BboS-125]AYP68412.1 hypothetical protein BboS125_00043 [Bacillus phage vB_BboS-125]